MSADQDAAIRRTAAWAVRKLRAKKLRLSIKTLEPRESRLWLGEFYESVKTLLFAYSEEDEADGPCDEPWQVLSFSADAGSDPLSDPRAYHLVFSLTKSCGALLVRGRDGKFDDVPWMRASRAGEGCLLELLAEGDFRRAAHERYLIPLWGSIEDAPTLRKQIRLAYRPQCGIPWIWAGRVELEDSTVVVQLLRTFPGFRRLTLKVPDA